MLKQHFPDLNIAFVNSNIDRPTSAEDLEKTALEMNCPKITFMSEELLKKVPIRGDEKLMILTQQTDSRGGHWITLFPVSDFSTSYYFFDSYGQNFKNKYYDIYHYWPEHLRIVPLNNTDFQSDKTAVCGWYGLCVIYCWYILSNKQLKSVLQLIPVDKTKLFEENTEFSRHYNDSMIVYFVQYSKNHTKEEVINHFKIK